MSRLAPFQPSPQESSKVILNITCAVLIAALAAATLNVVVKADEPSNVAEVTSRSSMEFSMLPLYAAKASIVVKLLFSANPAFQPT